MGLFDRNETILQKYITILKKRSKEENNRNINDALEYLKDVESNKQENVFKNEEVLVSFIDMVIDKDKSILQSINEGISIFEKNVIFDSEIEFKAFLKLFEKNGVVDNNLFSQTLYSLFEDKNAYFSIMNIIMTSHLLKTKFNYTEKYIISVSPYISDVNILKNDVISFLNEARIAGDMNALINRRVEEAKERLGIYSIDEKIVSSIDRKIKDFSNSSESLLHLIDEANKLIIKLNTLPEEIRSQLMESKKYLQVEVNNIVNGALDKLKEQYNLYLKMEKDGLKGEADQARLELIRLLDEKKRELNNTARIIEENTKNELGRIDKYTSSKLEQLSSIDTEKTIEHIKEVGLKAVNDLQAVVKTSPELEKMLADGDFIKKISDLSIQKIETHVIEDPLLSMAKEEPLPLSQYLDESIPYKKRIKALREKMEVLKSRGYVFHYKFEEVLASVLEGDNPYLIGPSGCGKTHIVKMIADLIEVPLVEIGRIVDFTTIVGFSNAKGTLTPTNFFYCYKNGKIAFCDELDNSIPDATVTLNSFMSNQEKDDSFAFPGNVVIKKHPNFRIISAGNTSGNGSNEEFNARGILDESVQQRVTPIYIGYDSKIEDKILESYPDWYSFAIEFRKATDNWARDNSKEVAPGVFTTRDAKYLKKYLDHESKTMEQIINSQFIQTKDIDYLTELLSLLEREYSSRNINGQEQFKVFKKNVNDIVKNGGRRY